MKAAINILSHETGLTTAYLLRPNTKVKAIDAVRAMETYESLTTDRASVRTNFIQLEYDRATILKSYIERKYKVDLCSSRRTKLIDYKQTFMFLCSENTALSQQMIVEMIGLRSHASVCLACKKIKEICSVDRHMVELIKEIKTGWEKELMK